MFRGLWRLVGRRLGWLAVANLARSMLRRGADDRVDRAASELAERLPAPVRSAVESLPGNPLRAGGGALVAGRSARQLASGAAGVTRAANTGRRRLSRGVGQVSGAVERRPRPVRRGRAVTARLGEEVARESEASRRRLRSRMLRHLVDDAAADDALLDVRSTPAPGSARSDDEWWTPPEPPPAVAPGRRRGPRWSTDPPVARVQRTYQRPRRPWDR